MSESGFHFSCRRHLGSVPLLTDEAFVADPAVSVVVTAVADPRSFGWLGVDCCLFWLYFLT